MLAMEGPSSASVVFTALSGAGPSGAAEPACYLLEIDECCLLLDCGSEPHFDAAALTERLRDVAPRVDAVPNPYLSRECGPTGMAGLPSA